MLQSTSIAITIQPHHGLNMSIETIREFLGWCTVINFGLFFGVVKVMLIREWASKVKNPHRTRPMRVVLSVLPTPRDGASLLVQQASEVDYARSQFSGS